MAEGSDRKTEQTAKAFWLDVGTSSMSYVGLQEEASLFWSPHPSSQAAQPTSRRIAFLNISMCILILWVTVLSTWPQVQVGTKTELISSAQLLDAVPAPTQDQEPMILEPFRLAQQEPWPPVLDLISIITTLSNSAFSEESGYNPMTPSWTKYFSPDGISPFKKPSKHNNYPQTEYLDVISKLSYSNNSIWFLKFTRK